MSFKTSSLSNCPFLIGCLNTASPIRYVKLWACACSVDRYKGKIGGINDYSFGYSHVAAHVFAFLQQGGANTWKMSSHVTNSVVVVYTTDTECKASWFNKQPENILECINLPSASLMLALVNRRTTEVSSS